MSNQKVRVINEGIIYRNPKPHVKSIHAYFPWVVYTADNQLIASFVLGEAFESVNSNTYISHSEDMGKTWSEPLPIISPSELILRSNCARITDLGNGHLATMMVRSDRSSHPEEGLANPGNIGFVPTDLLLLHSFDNGKTWTRPNEIEPPLIGPSFEACSPIVVLKGGTWLWSTSTWRGWDGYSPNGMKMVALLSDDEGKTWKNHLVAMDGTGEQIIYWEGKVIELNNGSMLATAWAFDEKTGTDLPNHYAVSNDKGKTWTTPVSMNILGQTMATVQMPDDRIVVVYRRMDVAGLWLSVLKFCDNNLETEDSVCLWNGAQASDLKRENMVTEFNELKFGAPCITKLSEDSLFIAFWCYEKIVSNIRWVEVAL